MSQRTNSPLLIRSKAFKGGILGEHRWAGVRWWATCRNRTVSSGCQLEIGPMVV